MTELESISYVVETMITSVLGKDHPETKMLIDKYTPIYTDIASKDTSNNADKYTAMFATIQADMQKYSPM